jgi:hypothetical protein
MYGKIKLLIHPKTFVLKYILMWISPGQRIEQNLVVWLKQTNINFTSLAPESRQDLVATTFFSFGFLPQLPCWILPGPQLANTIFYQALLATERVLVSRTTPSQLAPANFWHFFSWASPEALCYQCLTCLSLHQHCGQFLSYSEGVSEAHFLPVLLPPSCL